LRMLLTKQCMLQKELAEIRMFFLISLYEVGYEHAGPCFMNLKI
jgi:hypothetical protein